MNANHRQARLRSRLRRLQAKKLPSASQSARLAELAATVTKKEK